MSGPREKGERKREGDESKQRAKETRKREREVCVICIQSSSDERAGKV